jgi:peptidoglycan/xylan/chitin deacetylase (PgdA/CDA1 family)
MTRPLVLYYHAVSDRWPAPLAVSPDRLRTQLEYLRGQGYEGVTFSQLVAGDRPRRAMAVTFDDGYRSVFDRALPLLSELGMTGTVFVPTGLTGVSEPMSWRGIEQWVGTPFEDELMPLSWDQARALRDAGWEIGSHTVSHARLPDLGHAAVVRELVDSRERLARELGVPCRTLAYPYGAQDRRVREAAREAGYAAAAGVRVGPLDPYCWPRVGAYAHDVPWRFRLKVSPMTRTFRATRVGRGLDWLRSSGHDQS